MMMFPPGKMWCGSPRQRIQCWPGQPNRSALLHSTDVCGAKYSNLWVPGCSHPLLPFEPVGARSEAAWFSKRLVKARLLHEWLSHTIIYIYVSTYVNTYQHRNISPYITIYHHISTYVNPYQRHISTYQHIENMKQLYSTNTYKHTNMYIHTHCILGVLKWGIPILGNLHAFVYIYI